MRIEPTQPQHDFVDALKRKLRLTSPMLDAHCQRKYDGPYASLDRYQVSALIDEMQGWVTAPADLQREQGQQDLPGFTA